MAKQFTARNVNKNVSTGAVSRAERVLISELLVVSESPASSRSNASFVWKYFGALHQHQASDCASGASSLVDNDRLYCRFVNYDAFCPLLNHLNDDLMIDLRKSAMHNLTIFAVVSDVGEANTSSLTLTSKSNVWHFLVCP